MTYITDEEIEALPEDPIEKFIALERIVRARYQDALERLATGLSAVPTSRRYMSIVLPAAIECGIEALQGWKQPTLREDWPYYEGFIADVDFCLTSLRLRRGARVRQYSVAFDAATKMKLRRLLDEFRSMVDRLEVSLSKKERIHACLNALQNEVERERTRYEALADLMIEMSDDVSEVAQRLEPVVQLAERIAGIFGGAKRAENTTAQIPKSEEKKRIKGPNQQNGQKSSSLDRPFDDEIPI